MRAALTLITLILCTSQAMAMIAAETSYEAYVIRQHQLLDTIANGHSLSPQDREVAISAAALFIYLGPCEGSSRNIPGPPVGIGWLQYLTPVDPKDQSQAAALEMIATMIVPSLGRDIAKDSLLCRFALGMARPTWDGPPDP
jgi:hypothetical protein